MTAKPDVDGIVLTQQRFTYLGEPPDPAAASSGDTRWHVPIQLALLAGGQRTVQRVMLASAETAIAVPAGTDAVIVNESGHGFFRVRYAPELSRRLVDQLGHLEAIERFNLVNDTWSAAVAGLVPLTEYLDLTARFRGERDRNVWSIILGSLAMLNRIVEPGDRPKLGAFAHDRLAEIVATLGWSPRPGDDDLTRQLRGDVLRAFGTVADDAATQARAAELYETARKDPTAVDQNVLPALIAILAYTGDGRRYDEFLARFRSAATPQEEQRYLYALASFRQPDLTRQTLERTVSGEIRTQDAPFVARSVLVNVYVRELAWQFIKERWDTMDRLYPKHGLRRMCEGVTALATPTLEDDVHRFFAERKIDLGGKTLAQYLEQLRIAVTLRQREAEALVRYLGQRGGRA